MADPPKKGRNSLSEESMKRKRECDRLRAKTRVNIGQAFPRWRALLERTASCNNDSDLAVLLIDRHERDPQRDETPSRCPDKGHPSTPASLTPNEIGTVPGADAMVPKAVHDDLKQKYKQLHTECDNLRMDIKKLKAESAQLKTMVRNIYWPSS